MSAEKPTVAVLGTGIMGGPIARNIASAGIEVRAWNRTREKAEPLSEAGVTVTDTPAEAVDGADIVLTMLADGQAVENVMTEGGALDAMRADALWVQSSTVGIGATEGLAQLAEERAWSSWTRRCSGKAPAEQGQLTVLASGWTRRRQGMPVFDAIGSNDHAGESVRRDSSS